MDILAELHEKVEFSSEELLESLADSSTLGGLPFGPERRRIIGRAVFDGWFDKVRDEICGKRLALTGETDAANITKDALAILGALIAYADQAPVVTLSVLIAKFGVDNLCRGWKADAD